MNEPRETIRIDKWLWYARFFKTRSLSAKCLSSGGVRVNSTPISKPAFGIGVGDNLTFRKERTVRVIQVLALGQRRGPAPEAALLYKDLAPPAPVPGFAGNQNPKYEGKGRPDKKTRRRMNPSDW